MRSSAGSQITDVFLGIKLDSCCRSACEFSLDMANFLLQVLGIIRCFGAVIHLQKNWVDENRRMFSLAQDLIPVYDPREV